jgi:hypothetical protein
LDKNHYYGFSLTVILILISLTNPLPAQKFEIEAPRENTPYRVPKVNSTINVDAFLDEPFWEEAVKIDANIEVRPGENIEAPVKTEVLLAYDDSQIFVAFKAFDPDPSQIRAHYCDRDKIFDDDWILILFDTFNDQRRTYDFACNPLGIQSDFIETTTSGSSGDWDAIWESDGRITDEGYIVEMAIPFSSLNFPATEGDQIWGFDAVRSYPRTVRHHIGVFPRDRNNNCYMCQSEKLIGFAGASPGNNIEIVPTVSALVTQERADFTVGKFVETERRTEPGVTAQWGITPNITLSSTINPDFSNIEADILQLDINNQFAIYYPEKRPFFLESADFFNTPLTTVHTRTLADPQWGIKVSGREGIHTVGVFSAQDEITNYLFPGSESSNSTLLEKHSQGSAVRYKADISESSNIGLLMTDRRGDNYLNQLASVDGDFKFTKTDRFIFQVLGSQTQYPDYIASEFDQPTHQFKGKAYRVYYSHRTSNFEIYGKHRDIDNNLRADLGFISQTGIKYTEIGGRYMWRRDPGHWYNWLSLQASYDYRRDQNNQLLHRAWTGGGSYEGPLQSHISWYGEIGEDHYDGRLFKMNWMRGCFGLRILAPVWFHFSWRYGDQIDYANSRPGTRLQVQPTVHLNLGLRLRVELDHTYEQLDVQPGRLYTANINRIKLVYQFTKRLFIRTILQYRHYKRNAFFYIDEVDPKSESLFNQFLLSYKINPQTVFFLGYSDDYYGDQSIGLTQTNRTVFCKIGYALSI